MWMKLSFILAGYGRLWPRVFFFFSCVFFSRRIQVRFQIWRSQIFPCFSSAVRSARARICTIWQRRLRIWFVIVIVLAGPVCRGPVRFSSSFSVISSDVRPGFAINCSRVLDWHDLKFISSLVREGGSFASEFSGGRNEASVVTFVILVPSFFPHSLLVSLFLYDVDCDQCYRVS